MLRSRIDGTGAFLPGEPIGNDALMDLFGRRARRLCEAIGVKQRHWALDPARGFHRTGLRTSEMATRAAAAALDDAGRPAKDIDLIVLVTSTPDYPFPATVTLVQDALGIQECTALELRAACAGVPQAFAVADLFLRAGKARTALVLGAELSSCFIEAARAHADPDEVSDDILLSAVLFGDGAGAAVLSAHEGADERDGILATVLNSMGGGRPPGFLCAVGGSVSPFARDPAAAHISHDFRAILEMGPRMALRAFIDLKAATALEYDDFALIVPPQANPVLTAETLSAEGLDRERIFSNADRVGNTSSASLLIALDEIHRTGRLAPGDRVALLGAEASKWLYGAVALTWTMKGG